MNGILLIDKPERMSSHGVITRLRYGGFELDRIGHGGTLDPLATGLLIVLLGRAVKLAEYVIGHDKTYLVTGVLGKMRDTFDEEGSVIAEDHTPVSREQLERVLAEFPSEYEQMPPAYSAIKIRGVPAYRHARQGRSPNLAARRIRIYRMELLDFQYPRFDLVVQVSAGTYIRSLVVDIAQRLGTLAYVGRLRRTAGGPFTVEGAHKVQELQSWSPEQLEANLVPMEQAVMEFPAVEISAEQGRAYVCGQWLKNEEIAAGPLLGTDPTTGGKNLLRVRCAGQFIALGFLDDGYLKAEKVLLR